MNRNINQKLFVQPGHIIHLNVLHTEILYILGVSRNISAKIQHAVAITALHRKH